MTAPEIDLRSAVYTHLSAKLISESYSYNGFSIREAYVPASDSNSEFLQKGILWVAGGLGDRNSLNRSHAYETRTPIHLFYQKNITKFDDVDEVNEQVNLIDDLNETLRVEFRLQPYGWDGVNYVNDRDHPPLGINPAMLRASIFEVNAIHYFFRGKA